MMRRLALVVAAAAAVSACGGARTPTAFEISVARAQRAESAGRFTEASEAYEAAAREATRDRERDHARYLAAIMLLRAEDVRDAVTKLTPIAAASPPREDTPDAAFRIAEIHIDHGDPARGWAEMEQYVTQYASTGLAHSALRLVLEHKDETEGKASSLAYLRRLEAGPLAESEVGELVAYEIATHLRDTGDHAAARDAFVDVARRWPYPHGTLFDDSLYHASEEDERLGRYPEAIEDLRTMLREREVVGPFVMARPNNMFGSYQRRLFTPAQLRIAYLYAVRLGDRAAAREALHTLYADFKTSERRPEALWLEAELWRDDGDAKTSCDRLDTLVTEFPDSRYVPCAHDVCPSVARPEKSDAPKACHAYLMTPHRFDGVALKSE